MRFAVLGLLVAFVAGTHSLAYGYTGLVVFGDSLSDAGNSTASSLGFVPGSAYWKGRYSNGPVYVERLAEQLGFGPMKCSALGGNNFACGGARTAGTGGDRGRFVDDLNEQVDRFLARRSADPDALYIVWVGANDLLDGQRDVKVPIRNITADIHRLHQAGAKHFLVMNLPQLGSSPRYKRRPQRGKSINKLSIQFNQQFTPALNQLEKQLPDLKLQRFDIQAYFDDVVAHPADYGLTDVRTSAAPGLDVGVLFYNKSLVTPSPEKHLYWDIVHPTATMHKQLANRLQKLLASETQHQAASSKAIPTEGK